MRRTLTEADRAAWSAYTGRHVTALDGTPPVVPPPEPAGLTIGPAPLARSHTPVPRPSRAVPIEIGSSPGGIDASTWARFRGGRVPVARTLDLHGRTAQRAFAVLHSFLRTAHADRVRCVEVITGRGSGTEGGVIRRELPLWLNGPELRPLVLAASHPHPANPGSVRVLLRRVRGAG